MIKRAFGLAMLVPFFAAIVWLAVQVADRTVPVTDAQIVVVPNEVKVGHAMQIDVRVFYRQSCEVYVTRHLYDHTGAVFTAPQLTLAAGPVGLVHSASTVPLPLAFAPGDGRIVSQPSYGCNWFQRRFWPVSAPVRVGSFVALAPAEKENWQ